ncbi:MAG: peptide chain release factor N(5)-glutamine methyltransferase [Planctomycetota bacterium]
MTHAPSALTVLEILRRSTTWLGGRGVENPRLDAEILVAHGLGMERLGLYLAFDRPVDEAERARIRELIRERGRRVPVAYLTGEREFYSLAFHVEPGVLVPRPETEHLVEVVLPIVEDDERPVFADVGTGSGCVAISLLVEAPRAVAYATDISPLALEVARRNAERHDVLERLVLLEGDLLEPVRATADWGRLDAVVCNPPYVLHDDESVEPGVREHEPPEALFVEGDDPLAPARRVAETAREGLLHGGVLALEIGLGSGEEARRLLEGLGYVDVRLTPDLAGIDRVVSGRRG